MDDQLLRRAAVVQAKLKFLEQQKDSFTDREDIVEFQRLKKRFDSFLSHHRDELTADPLARIRDGLENERRLIDKLRQIDSQARLHEVALKTQKSDYLTPEFVEGIINWVPWRKQSLHKELSEIQSRLSPEYWDKDSGELLPYAKVIAEALGQEDLLIPDTKELVVMSSSRGSRYEALLGTITSIEELIAKKVFYSLQAGERLGPLLLDDLDKLLSERIVFAFDLAWHHAVDAWQPLFELATSLRKLDILRPSGKSAPFTEAMLQRKLFYWAREGEVRGPFSVDDLNLMLSNGTVSESDPAWHSSLADWRPLSELIPVLKEQKLFHPSKLLPIKRWIKGNRGAVILYVVLVVFFLGLKLFKHATADHGAWPEATRSESTPPLTNTPFSIKLVRSATIQGPSGTITLQAGTTLPYLSFDSNNVRFRYNGVDYEIPADATDLNHP